MPDLAQMLNAQFADGADEILVRVSRYQNDVRTPAEYQAIVRFHNRLRPWGVGVHASAETALRIALGDPSAMPTDKPDEGGVFG